jgi:hypothetical protein
MFFSIPFFDYTAQDTFVIEKKIWGRFIVGGTVMVRSIISIRQLFEDNDLPVYVNKQYTLTTLRIF